MIMQKFIPKRKDGNRIRASLTCKLIMCVAGLVFLSTCLQASASYLPEKEIKGQVIDSASGSPLEGVTIQVKGGSSGATTNANGEFSLAVPENAVLVVSYLGHQSREVAVNGSSSLRISLSSTATGLDQLVVVGYGKQRKINLTGAVTQISGKEVQNRMASNLVYGLQGLIPNVNVSITNDGGQPGAVPALNVRGPGSLSGGSPFVLVDGVPQDLNTVNPYDIESITVLKDASASAIYGIKAAYGVILVTTKSGNINASPSISYSDNVGWSKPTRLPDQASSLEYAQAWNDAFVNAGQPTVFSKEYIARLKQYIKDPKNTPVFPEGYPYPAGFGVYDASASNANTDWFKAFYKDWQFTQSHNLSVEGGGNTVKYFISGGYYDQGALFRYGDESYKRYNITSNISSNVTPWLQVGLRTRYVRENTDMPHAYAGLGSYYHEIPRRWPGVPVTDANGHFGTYGLAMMTSGGRDITINNELLNSINIVLTPLKGWTINADVNLKQDLVSRTRHEKTATWYDYQNIPYPVPYTFPNWYDNSSQRESYSSSNIYSSYNFERGKHHFTAMIGFQAEVDNYEGVQGLRYDLVSDNIPSLSTATGNVQVSGPKGHWATEGYFGRLNYNYEEKYLLEVSGRYDGTSRFAPGRRWGLFPSVSAGYNIAKESFWNKSASRISLLKIRASYGSLGNQDISSSYYPYLSNLGVNTNLAWITGSQRPLYITAPGLVSADLTWEVATSFNVGLDAEAFDSRLSLSFDWYRRATDNMFGPIESYPAVLGTKGPQRNNASLVTTGFELTLGWKDKLGALGYNVQFILSDNTTRVTQYKNTSGTLSDYYEGKRLGEIWGYVSRGIYQTDEDVKAGYDQSFLYSHWQAGDVSYLDLNGDGKINNGSNSLGDHGDLKVIGNNTPRYSYGLNLSLNYAHFDLALFIQGVAKRDLFIGGNYFWGFVGSTAQSTLFTQQMDYWRADNPGAYFPRPYMSSENSKNQQTQTRYLQNGAYVRLKNLQVGYSLPPHVLSKTFVKYARIYFSGENLFTATKLIKIFDPEATGGGLGAGKLYPLSETISAGINLNF